MGLLDKIKGKLDQVDKTYNPLRKVTDVLNEASAKVNTAKPPPPIKTMQTPTGAIIKKPFPEEGK